MLGGVLLLVSFANAAHAESVSINSTQPVMAAPPAAVRLTFDTPPDIAATQLSVFTTTHDRVDVGPLHSTGDPLTLAAELPPLEGGIYTVVWQSTTPGGPAHALSGAYAFQYDAVQASPPVLAQPQPRFALPTIDRVIPRWLVYTAILTCIGSLLLRLMVWSPVLREFGRTSPAWTRSVERRLSQVTIAAMLLFVPSSLLQAAWDAANAAKHPLFSEGFNVGQFASYLSSPGAGTLWSLRLVLIGMACVSFGAAFVPWRKLRAYARPLTLASLSLCATELLVRTLPGDLTSDTPRAVMTWLLDWTHLVGAAVWVGGLIGLAVTASLMRPASGSPSGAARQVIRRFSNLALICVGALTVSGIWSAWLHVGSPDQFVTTLYGRTLLLKLGVVMVLLVLGALNLLYVLPRLERARQLDPDRPSLVVAALRHFRRLVILEAVLGIVVLAIVPFMSGSARTQDAQLRSADLSQVATIASTPVVFRPSALQPGLVDYDVVLPDAARDRVQLTFESAELGVPPTTVLAAARGDGVYRATGIYTPIVGAWQVQVRLGSLEAQSATFPLAIRNEPVAPPPNRAPAVESSTLAIGMLEALLVVAGLISASWLSRRLTAIPYSAVRRATNR
jgi:putative copper export protein/methionine-rich copper-binding protein CopC